MRKVNSVENIFTKRYTRFFVFVYKSVDDYVRGFTGIKYVSQEPDNIGQIMEKVFTG